MAFEDSMRSLREFDINDLDFDNIGAWPTPVKAIIWVVVLCGVLAAGYYYHIKNLQAQLAQVEAGEELKLRERILRRKPSRRLTWMPTGSRW